MRRIQFIEIHDQPWFPKFLRDETTNQLQFLANFGNLYRPIAPRLWHALEDAGAQRVLDLCSGGAGPWLRLYKNFERVGYPPPEICLTDKFPNEAAFRRASAVTQGKILFQSASVDATDIPAELGGFRTLFTSFHHFPPPQALSILKDAVNRQQGIAIFEISGRQPLTMFLVLFLPLYAWLAAPFLRPFRWARLLWTYLIPVVPLVLLFDGIVSCLRTYSSAELIELRDKLSANEYKWDIGEDEGRYLPVTVTYLIGHLPRARTK